MEQIKKRSVYSGLNSSDVEKSRRKHGFNTISKKKRKTFLQQYLASFGDPIIKILLIALAVNVVFLFRHADWYESAGIAVAVLLATFVSTLSEYGSESAFEKLQEHSKSVNCRVKRNGELTLLPVSHIVVGDIVLLQAGEKIPADGYLISGEILVDQSALNGESKEMRKTAQANINNSRLSLSSVSGVFTGSVVCQGDAVMVVDTIGDNTFYGKLAVEVQEEKIESPLKRRLGHLAATISKIGYSAAIIVAVANIFHNFVIDSGFNTAIMILRLSDPTFVFGTLLNALTLGITVIVMAVPEGLPMMITVVLSANMKKMLKDNVLVRKLVGIETAGSLNILFTDKTGTLTKGRLQVTTFLNGSGDEFKTTSEIKKSAPILFNELITGCVYNTDSAIGGGKKYMPIIGGNATDRAVLGFAAVHAKEIKNTVLQSHQSFNSTKKFSVSEILQNGKIKYLVKGAPEIILKSCNYYIDNSGNKKSFDKTKLIKKIQAMTGNAIRILAVAQSENPIDFNKGSSLSLVGIMGICDDIRNESPIAVKEITKAGIQIVMITGDNKETAVAIAKKVGLLHNKDQTDTVFTGSELAAMSDFEIKRKLKSIRVIARALPTDKSRLVRLSQEMGLVSGMTGDGINDAPALKKADVGFAMGSGTEVAKEAGDIVIVDNNISSIANAILYGRTIFKSIRKFIIFQLTMNFCAVALSVVCPFIGVDAPLTVMQMLWVNMIMDTLAGLAFAGEAPLKEYMNEPPKKRGDSIINRYMYSQILFAGIYTTIVCIFFLKSEITHKIFRFSETNDYFMTAFFTLFIFMGVLNSLNARTYRLNLFSNILKNKAFIVIMALVCFVQIILIYNGGSVFRTIGISAWHLQFIFILSLTIIPVDFLRKFLLRKFGRKGHI